MTRRQVFGLADMGLSARLVVSASRSLWISALSRRSFPLTAAGQFRIRTGFPFEPADDRVWQGTDEHNISC